LMFWPPGKPKEAQAKPACCGSWRCEGKCARYRAAVDFARISEALEPYKASEITYAVLTLDRNGTYTGEQWSDSTEAYRELSRMTRNLLSRLNRWLLKKFGVATGNRWVGVAEAHRSGWPHMNLIIVSKQLANYLEDGRRQAERDGLTQRQQILARGELLAHILGSGWGPQSTMEVARSKGALAGYMVKLAGELDKDGDAQSRGRITGEVAKLTQVPTNAPLGFRRLRSGHRFLPPRRKGGNTGAMLDASGLAMGVPHPYDLTKNKRERAKRRARAKEVNEAIIALYSPSSSP
ncbi:unnamed protein product, partial [marine sediment metagenome]